MKICATCGLSNTMAMSYFTPVSIPDKVEKITIVRNFAGEKIKKIEYRTISRLIKKITLRGIFARLVLLIWENLKNRYDLLLAFFLQPHGILACIVAKLFRKPVVISLIGTDLNVHLKSWYKSFLFPFLRWTDVITVTGKRSKDYLISQGIPDEKIFIVPNPVNVKRFKPSSREKVYDAIFVGRLSWEKAVHNILKIVAKTNSNHRELKLAIVGDGPLREELTNMAHKLELGDSVDFVGLKKNVPDYLNSAKILLMTSVTEGVPLAMLEAMACGLPCVVPNVGDITDAAIHNYNAKVIEKNDDIEGFTEAIIELLEDSEMYDRLSQNALQTGRNHAYESIAKVWEEIFDYLGL